MLDAQEFQKKEQTIEGISDMFALSALIPEKTRLYQEYNEMKVKYQENLTELTRVRNELDTVRDGQGKLRTTLAHAVATTDGSGAKLLAAEEKVRAVHKLRQNDADVAITAVESATRRADVSEKRLRLVEERLRSHPLVVRERLGGKNLESLLPELLTLAENKLQHACDSEREIVDAQTSLTKAVRELENVRTEAGAQAGNVGRHTVEMDSLRAKLAKSAADLSALQVEHALMCRNKEEIANEAEQITLSMEHDATKREERLGDLEERYRAAQQHIARLTAKESDSSKSSAVLANKFKSDTANFRQEADGLCQKVMDLEAMLKQSVRAHERAETRATTLESRVNDASMSATNLQKRVREAEATLQSTKVCACVCVRIYCTDMYMYICICIYVYI